jgi:phosphoglycerol transferase MdoB-like AlkP superfamily enzyme
VLARFRLQLLYFLFWLGFFTAARVTFLLFFRREAGALPGGTLAGILLHGIPLDLSSSAYLSFIPFLLIALSSFRWITRTVARIVLTFTLVATAALALMAAADLEIFRQWGRRIDASVLQYLAHPREIWASAGGGSPWLLLGVFALLTGAFGLAAWRFLQPRLLGLPAAHPAAALPLAFSAALLVLPARGGIQQIPINQSSAYFSTEPFANQAAINAGWNFFDSWKRGLNRRDNPYLVMPPDSARALMEAVEPADPPRRMLSSARPNLLLIVWEGFTARSVPRLGGVPGATPEFAALADSGLLFTRLYAAGDRTEKGLAALLAGAPTVPNASILMVPSKARTLPILSRDLRSAGYATSFYYGGELGFANLRGFVLEGGYERILGKEDFPDSALTSKWGAHDAAVADRVAEDLRGAREPFFTTWLTLSSHEPFDIPGAEKLAGADGETRFLASLRYTDSVVAGLLRRLALEPWWERTLVIIVADHSKKLEKTDATVPYKSAESWYRIPMLWTGGALAARGERVDEIMSQTDLAPTILQQLGIPGGDRYRFGRAVFASPRRAWAYYGFDDGFGLVTPRGSLVWEHIPDRITSSTGVTGPGDLRLGKAILQVTFQDYLDR